MDMNKEEQAYFESVVVKHPSALTEADKDYLRARADLLTEEQKEVMGLNEETPKKKTKE
jgi:hypothetical protein